MNWERGTVHVQQEVVALRGVPVIQEPKTPESRRTVRLPAQVMAELKRHKAGWAERKLQAAEWADHDLVFCTASGKPTNPAHARRSFDRIVARAGVPNITIHGMRHCHAVRLLRAGRPVKVVSERLGHKDVTTTLNVYAAALPDMQDHAVEVLDRLMGRSAQASWVAVNRRASAQRIRLYDIPRTHPSLLLREDMRVKVAVSDWTSAEHRPRSMWRRVGTRFLASEEASAAEGWKRAILAAESEDAVRFEAWSGRPEEAARHAEQVRAEIMAALRAGRAHELVRFTGQTAGLVRDVLPAGEIVRRMVAEAERALTGAVGLVA